MTYSTHLLLNKWGLLLSRVAEAGVLPTPEECTHTRGIVCKFRTTKLSIIAIKFLIVLWLRTRQIQIVFLGVVVRDASPVTSLLAVRPNLQSVQGHVVEARVSIAAKLLDGWQFLRRLILFQVTVIQVVESAESWIPLQPIVLVRIVIVLGVLVVTEVIARHFKVFFNFLDWMVDKVVGTGAAGIVTTSARILHTHVVWSWGNVSRAHHTVVTHHLLTWARGNTTSLYRIILRLGCIQQVRDLLIELGNRFILLLHIPL